MESLAKLFDPYNREARVGPAVLVLAPALLLIFVAYPQTVVGEFPKNALAVLILLAAAYLFAGIARSAGKRIEDDLFRKWDGVPTTAMLRQRDTTLDAVTKARYHIRLAEICTDFTWPSTGDEQSDPAAADLKYASAVAALRARRRGDEHANVLRENAQYGFRRNMYGLRPAATVIAILAALCAALLLAHQVIHERTATAILVKLASDPRYALLLTVNAGIAVVWRVLVRQSWVREAARDYARALLNTLDLAPSTSPVERLMETPG
jgi:hypothetical protein